MAFAFEHFPEFPYPPSGMGEVEEVERYLTSLHRSMQEYFSTLPRDITDGVSVIDLDDLANTALADPGADRIMFWDDSDGQFEFLVANNFLSISASNLNVDALDEDDMASDSATQLATQQSIKAYADAITLGLGDLSDPDADRVLFWDDSETVLKWLSLADELSISATTLSVDHDLCTNFVVDEHIDWKDASDNFKTTGTSKLYGDIYTDRWLNQDTNTFIGIDVCGGGNLAHGAGYEGYHNTFFGWYAGRAITTGYANSIFGSDCGRWIESGYGNSFFGLDAGYYVTDGDANVCVGMAAGMENITGSYNIAIGYEAGRYQANGVSVLSTPETSIYIGGNSRSGSGPGPTGGTNEIVIGHGAIGHGSNTITLGDANITDNYLTGNLHCAGTGHDGFSDFVANEHIDWTNASAAFSTSGTLGCGNVTGGTYNALTLAAVTTGFTIAGGTTPKTLTMNDDFIVSTQLTAIGANTTHRSSDGTDHGYIDQDLQIAASPTFAALTVTGAIGSASNTDVSSVFGRTRIGHLPGYSDYACISHYDKNDVSNYALLQSSAGATFLNASSGQNMVFRINNATIMTMGADKLVLKDTGYLEIPYGDTTVTLSGLSLKFKVSTASGVWAKDLYNVTDDGDVSFIKIGVRGDGQTLTYGFIGTASGTPWMTMHANKSFGFFTGTAPSSSITDVFLMYSADIAAGNAAPHFRTENDAIVKLYQQAHIADAPGDTAANNATTINAILVALENLGLLAGA